MRSIDRALAAVRDAVAVAIAIARAALGDRLGRSRVLVSRPAAVMRRLVLAFIVVGLFGTQAIGLVHRVEHGSSAGWIDVAGGPGAASEHHCAAIDALALGAGPPVAISATADRSPAAAPVLAACPSGPARAHVGCFRARAPPPSPS